MHALCAVHMDATICATFCLYRITEVWEKAMESSCFYYKADLKSVIISDDIKMSHTAAVWKEAVGLLWPKENQQ